MNSKPPARRRSCLKAQNTNVESDTSDGTGLIEKDDTATISLPRKRVSFSHRNEVKEFQNVSVDEREHNCGMEIIVQQKSGQNDNGDGVDENAMPAVDMSMTYTLPMGDGTFIVDSTRQNSSMCVSFTTERKSSSHKKRRSKIQDATFIIQDLSHPNNDYNPHPENDMSMSRVFLENELPKDENVLSPTSQYQYQHHQVQEQKLQAEEKQLRNQVNSTNVEQPNPYGVSPDMSLTISGEAPPIIEPPSKFHDNSNVLVYQHEDLNYIPKQYHQQQQQQYEEEQEQQIPEISMMMESMAVQNTTEYNYNHHHHVEGESSSGNNNNKNYNNNMSMTVDLDPSKISHHYYSAYQDAQQQTRREDGDMSITMNENENEASPLDKTGFYYETLEGGEEEEEEGGRIDTGHPSNHTQYYPDSSMTMDLESLIKLSSTQIKLQDQAQEYSVSDMSMTMAIPIVVPSSSQPSQLNNVQIVNENPIVMSQHIISNVYSTIHPNDEKETENFDERAEKRRRQTYTIAQGNMMMDEHPVFKLPIPTTISSSQNQSHKNRNEMRKSTVPVPENSAFGRFGSVKTPRRKLPDDISSLMLIQQQEKPRTSSVPLVRGEKEEEQQQKQQTDEVVHDSTTPTIAVTSNQISSSSSSEIPKPIDITPPEIMRSNSSIIMGTDITMNVEPYAKNQSSDTQLTVCNEPKISTQAIAYSSSNNAQPINYSNFNKQEKFWVPAPSIEPTTNTVTNKSKEFKERQKIILNEVHSYQQQKPHNSTKAIKSVSHSKGNKHPNTLEDKIVHLKLLKGLRLQRELISFSKHLQSLDDSKFSKTINEITGFVNPDFIQAEVKIREYEAIMKIREFPTYDPEDPLFVFARRKLAELYGENLENTF